MYNSSEVKLVVYWGPLSLSRRPGVRLKDAGRGLLGVMQYLSALYVHSFSSHIQR